MRLNGNHLSTTRQNAKSMPAPFNSLVAIGLAGLIILAWPGHLAAQVTTPPPPADSTDTTGNPPDQNAPDQNPANPNSPDQNPADQSRAQVPTVSQSPFNPPNTTIPQFPAAPANPISPYTSSSANPQSPQLTAPSLYVTGANDLSQIGTTSALSQAFSEVGASGFYNEPILENEAPPIERIRLGPFDLKAAVVTSVVGDDNLRTGDGPSGGADGGSKGDVTYAVTPAILLQYGDHDGQKGFATVLYSPTFTRYVHHSDENTDEYQNVALNAAYPFQRLTLNLTQTYSQTTGVNTDSTLRTSQTTSFTNVGATYEVDDKISLSSQAQEVINSFEGSSGQLSGGEGETITSLNNTATYRLSDKLTIGPNFNIGIDKPDDTGQQTFEQGTVGINYAPTEKIGVYAQGGAEIRQYEGAGSNVNPIFGVGVGYTPFDSTSIMVNASQSVHTDINDNNSASTAVMNQTVVNTSVGASVTQRIAQRFFLGFDFEYSHNDNEGGTGGTTAATTSQNTMTYRPSLQFAPTGWTSVALYYQYQSNQSNDPGSTYNDNQVGLSLSAQF